MSICLFAIFWQNGGGGWREGGSRARHQACDRVAECPSSRRELSLARPFVSRGSRLTALFPLLPPPLILSFLLLFLSHRRTEERDAAYAKSAAERERAAADGDAPLLATPRKRTGKVIGGGAAAADAEDEEAGARASSASGRDAEEGQDDDVRVVKNVLADAKAARGKARGKGGDKECVLAFTGGKEGGRER